MNLLIYISRKLGNTCGDRFSGCLTKEEKTISEVTEFTDTGTFSRNSEFIALA